MAAEGAVGVRIHMYGGIVRGDFLKKQNCNEFFGFEAFLKVFQFLSATMSASCPSRIEKHLRTALKIYEKNKCFMSTSQNRQYVLCCQYIRWLLNSDVFRPFDSGAF